MKNSDIVPVLVFFIILLAAIGVTIYNLNKVQGPRMTVTNEAATGGGAGAMPPATPSSSVAAGGSFSHNPFFKIIGAAVISSAVVLVLGYSKGQVTLELRGLKFSGTKGPATVWCLVYLVVMSSFSFV